MTRIAVELPEDIAKRLESAWRDVSRGTLEAVDTEAFLKERQAYLAHAEEDLEQDRRDLDRVRPQ
jgi:hypothetical protein